MKKDLTELVIIIDKSGSMYPLRDDVIGGYNSLIEKQKEDKGQTVVTTVFFNDEIDFVHEQVDIQSLGNIDRRSYNPSGCTALLDAMGDSIAFIKSKHSLLKEEDLPEHVIFSIMTDGLENASREYSYPRIKGMIELQKKCGWEFIFQGANIDVVKEANNLGIDRDMAMEFKATKEGVCRQMKMCCATIDSIKGNTKKRKPKNK